MYRLMAALFLLLAATLAASAQNLVIPSYWLNQRGSEMKLYSWGADGTFKGVYINHAAGFACQNTPYDLWGRAIGSHIKFMVIWTNWAADCKSKTVWQGRVRGGTIATRWILTGHDFPPLRGTDIFQQQP